MNFTVIFGAIELGLIFGILSLGLFVSFRVLNLPDLSVDGTFVTGVAVCSIFTLKNQPFLGLFLATLISGIAGGITGFLHTKLNIHAILAGILTMTGLYSINIRLMSDKPSIFLGNNKSVFSEVMNKFIFNSYDFGYIIGLFIIVSLLLLCLGLFLKTHMGMALRATGDNEAMVRSSSINTDLMKIIGFMICNGIVGLSGAVYAQYSQNATIGVGQGMLVLGLANIIIGEAFIRKKGVFISLLATLIGAIIYRILLTYVFRMGLPASDIRLFSAIIVILAISFPKIKLYLNRRKSYVRN